jgi:hypothetical protein
MRKQIKQNKLVLQRQTIHDIPNVQLSRAAGGQYSYDANATCGFCKIVIC